MRYKIVLSYDGTPFCGWQRQPNGNSVQAEVENAVFKLFGERASVTGSGRTDAGVPREIRVLDGGRTSPDFHARMGAIDKTYMYLMYTGKPLPPLNDRALCLGFEPNTERMADAARALLGTHDFSTFVAAGGGAKTFTRTVKRADIERDGRFVMFYIKADGFLYNMVRIITAQLIKAGRGEQVDMSALIEKRDRAFAKELAPAHGLYLYKVNYGEYER